MEAQKIIDCSNHDPSNDALAKLNEWFQKKRLPGLEFDTTKQGADHQPTFTCNTKWETKIVKATAPTKKEAEKKIKSYIWISLVSNPAPAQPVGKPANAGPAQGNVGGIGAVPEKNENKKTVVNFENFRETLTQLVQQNELGLDKPVLVIDLTTIEGGVLKDPDVEGYCNSLYLKVIAVTLRDSLEWNGAITLKVNEEDKAMIQESVIRVLYYLLDHGVQKEVVLLSGGDYQHLKSVGEKTGQIVRILKEPQQLWA